MFEKFIRYFAKQHLLTNFIVIAIFIAGIFFWHNTSKEDMPDISFDFVLITANYPGATPEDVERLVTKPIEDIIKGIDGIYRVSSSSSPGVSSIRVELEPNYSDKDETITEIKNAVLEVKLPEDVIDDPYVRQWRTSKRAILDVALIHTNYHLLDEKARDLLQTYALALENQLLSLPEVNSIHRTGYLKKEIQIQSYPEKLIEYNIPFNKVMSVIKNSHIRQPAGSIEDKDETKVTLIAELDEIAELKNLIIQGGFEGQVIRLKDVADVQYVYEKNNSITKINGAEGVILNVVKSSSYGILQAMAAVRNTISEFQKNTLNKSPVKIVLLDDESESVRNRLSLIGINGLIGFVLILTMLFFFLNFKSGIWVAMGIPFTLCFTMVGVSMLGYTINNITLAAVIIVMGMIVDDAIVIAENISRLRLEGMDYEEATVKGTSYMLLPVIASIVTTCVAFLPLFAFKARFAKMIYFIPPIIFLMLGGSLFESIFILPSHMNLRMVWLSRIASLLKSFPIIRNYFYQKKRRQKKEQFQETHWFYKVEDFYGGILEKVLNKKWLLFLFFIGLFILALIIFKTQMKFTLFPGEETTQLHLTAIAPEGTKRYETAVLSKNIESIFNPYLGKEVVGYRTHIARSRRGGAVEENNLSMRIEIIPKEKRKKSIKQLLKEWNNEIEKVKGFEKIMFTRQHFGQSSGSPIEIIVQENNDKIREQVVNQLAREMMNSADLKNVEIERPIKNSEYRIRLRRDKLSQLGINPSSVAVTIRALLEGNILYELNDGDEEIKVRFSAYEKAKDSIYKVLNVPVENQGNYLVPLKNVVDIEKVVSANSINRLEYKRTTTLYAELSDTTELTPVEIAEYFEYKVFPKIISQNPTTVISFGGEVRDTRESKSDFLISAIMVLFFIYAILALLFNSLYKPFIIMMIIPFGLVGIILAFWFHGKLLFGFFAVIGALGLAGVVVNDSIVMLVKLDKEYDRGQHKELSNKQIANIAKTRLRAVLLTTLTTVAGLLPTAYGFAGYDALLAEMMLALAWGLMFGTLITLFLIPAIYSLTRDIKHRLYNIRKATLPMKKQKRVMTIFVVFILAFFLVDNSLAFVENKNSEYYLSLNEFIKSACKNDKIFQEILIEELLLNYKKTLDLPAKDLFLSIRAQYNLKLDGQDRGAPETDITLAKLFPFIGTEFSINYKSSLNTYNDKQSSALTFSISQAIGRNAFGKINRLQDKITGLEIEIAKHQIIEAYEDYLSALIKIYYNWYSAYEELETAEISYRESMKLLNNIRERQKNKIALQIDVDKLHIQVLSRQENLIRISNNYKKWVEQIKQSIRYDRSARLIPIYPTNYNRFEIDFQKDYEKIKNSSRTYKILNMLERKGGLEVDKFANALLPSADVILGYNIKGSDYAIEEGDSKFFIGFNFEFPFPGEKEHSQYEISKINLRKTSLSATNKRVQLYTELKLLYDQIKHYKRLLILDDEKIKLSANIFKEEEKNYRYGRISLNDLISAKNSLDENRYTKLLHSIQLNILTIEWLRITDQLIYKNEIQKE